MAPPANKKTMPPILRRCFRSDAQVESPAPLAISGSLKFRKSFSRSGCVLVSGSGTSGRSSLGDGLQ